MSRAYGRTGVRAYGNGADERTNGHADGRPRGHADALVGAPADTCSASRSSGRSGVRGGGWAAGTVLTALAFLALAAPRAEAQKAQWSDAVYVPGRWQLGRLVPARATSPDDSLAIVMRVDYFAKAPRFRLELRRTTDGANFGDPTVLLGNGADVQVMTPLGATPLARHALNTDTLVRAALAAAAGGRLQGAASGRIVERLPDGAIARVAFRRSQRSPTFDERMLDPRNASAGRQFLARGIASIGDQRSAGVVATAGARGVDRVETPRGSVPVTPDTLAVLRMERFVVSPMTLEEFLRQGALGPYAGGRQ